MLIDDINLFEKYVLDFLKRHQIGVGISVLAILATPLILRVLLGKPPAQAPRNTGTTSIMAPEKDDLLPPQSTPFTLAELRRFDGSDADLPIYVSIKGTVFDVTRKRDVYGPPSGSYRVFAGKDASRGFGLSSTRPEDAVPDWSTLGETELKTMDEWFSFFRKRYNVVGRVVDMPAAVQKYVWLPASDAK